MFWSAVEFNKISAISVVILQTRVKVAGSFIPFIFLPFLFLFFCLCILDFYSMKVCVGFTLHNLSSVIWYILPDQGKNTLYF